MGRLLLNLGIVYLIISTICWDLNMGEWGWFWRVIFIIFVIVGFIKNSENKD